MQIADPLDRKQTVDPPDQWDCVLEWNCRASIIYFLIFEQFVVEYLHEFETEFEKNLGYSYGVPYLKEKIDAEPLTTLTSNLCPL